MKLLEDRILAEGAFITADIVRVDSFLNHQVDPHLMEEMGKEFHRLFGHKPITKVLTVEASGIAIAIEAAKAFGVPMVFAKKSLSSNVGNDVWSAPVYSFTHGNTNNIIVSKRYLDEGDRVLIIDDFLANGAAMRGLISLCEQAGAEVLGCGVAIEKYYQPGGRELRADGYHVESLASIMTMDPETRAIEFHH